VSWKILLRKVVSKIAELLMKGKMITSNFLKNVLHVGILKIDGPLALDIAISKEAAELKNINSLVAGEADLLVAPDVVTGNVLSKALIYLAGVSLT